MERNSRKDTWADANPFFPRENIMESGNAAESYSLAGYTMGLTTPKKKEHGGSMEASTNGLKNVLVIEDDIYVRSVLSVALTEAGFNVIEASTGRQAIESLREMTPDLVLLDLGLPDIEGYEISKMMRDENVLAQVPVIIVSGRTGLQSRLMSFLSGAKAFIKKPFQIHELIEKAVYFTSHHRIEDENPEE